MYNELLDDGDSQFTSEKWELGNELEALKDYLIVKINFKEYCHVPSEFLIIEKKEKREIIRLSILFILEKGYNKNTSIMLNMTFKNMLYNTR